MAVSLLAGLRPATSSGPPTSAPARHWTGARALAQRDLGGLRRGAGTARRWRCTPWWKLGRRVWALTLTEEDQAALDAEAWAGWTDRGGEEGVPAPAWRSHGPGADGRGDNWPETSYLYQGRLQAATGPRAAQLYPAREESTAFAEPMRVSLRGPDFISTARCRMEMRTPPGASGRQRHSPSSMQLADPRQRICSPGRYVQRWPGAGTASLRDEPVPGSGQHPGRRRLEAPAAGAGGGTVAAAWWRRRADFTSCCGRPPDTGRRLRAIISTACCQAAADRRPIRLETRSACDQLEHRRNSTKQLDAPAAASSAQEPQKLGTVIFVTVTKMSGVLSNI